MPIDDIEPQPPSQPTRRQRVHGKTPQKLIDCYRASLINGHAFLGPDGKERQITKVGRDNKIIGATEEQQPKKRFHRTCKDPTCGKEFGTDNPKQLYCSQDCQRRAQARRQQSQQACTRSDPMSRITASTLKGHRCHSWHVALPPRPCGPGRPGRQPSRERSPSSTDGSAPKPFHVLQVPLAQRIEPRWRGLCRERGARNDCKSAA